MPTTTRPPCRRSSVGRLCFEALERRRLMAGYSVTELPFVPRDMNDAGVVVGVAGGHAVIWDGGVVTGLGTLGGPSSDAVAINNDADIVGSSTATAAGPSRATLWHDGAITDLGLGDGSAAVGINDSGVVAANAGGRALVWHAGQSFDLGTLGPGGADASDINDAGVVTGSSWAGGYDGAIGLPAVDTFLWDDGAMADLGTAPFTMSSYPRAINNAGQVVGSSTYYVNTGYGAAVVSRAFYYDGKTMAVLAAPGLQSWANDINDAGQIVGYAGGHAFLVEDGTYADLNKLVPPGEPALTAAVAVNNAGQILASNTAGRGVLLTPDAARVIDDGDTGFSTAGPAPTVLSGQGCHGDVRRLFAPTDRLLAARGITSRFRTQATWTFDDVAPGTYRVSATWTGGSDRAAAAPFTVFSNGAAVAGARVDQRRAPSDRGAYGSMWHDLATVTVSGGTLSVRLTNGTTGRVIADAVRLERVETPPAVAVAAPTSPALAAAAARRHGDLLLLATAPGALLG